MKARGSYGTLITFSWIFCLEEIHMQPCGTNSRVGRPIFVTPNPLLIAGVREVLAAAGMKADPFMVAPEDLAEALEQADDGLVILDGHALPGAEELAQLCRLYAGARFVIWATQPTGDLLTAALSCGVQGLLSTRLPLEEASHALLRIIQGERVFRFNTDPAALAGYKPLQFSARERHILMALAGGATNSKIAASLHTTGSTVKGCLARLFRKTGARNRRELGQLGHAILRAAERNKGEAEETSFDAAWMLENL
jgi:DNA-binding NarL/FixJ family response regulator